MTRKGSICHKTTNQTIINQKYLENIDSNQILKINIQISLVHTADCYLVVCIDSVACYLYVDKANSINLLFWSSAGPPDIRPRRPNNDEH